MTTLEQAVKNMKAHRGHLLSQYQQAVGAKKDRRLRDWEALDVVLYRLEALEEEAELERTDALLLMAKRVASQQPTVKCLIQFFEPTPGLEGWRATLSTHPWGDGRWYRFEQPVPESMLTDLPTMSGEVGEPVQGEGKQAYRPPGMPERSYE